ncbi:PREDICTED: uncharacterized protein LOC109179854 [Ipomoea nil]|uniref:uncharacterized protein LOC109179854 n=1 Tax=Ipomoea nil TaxID=35883 RepID=UPI000901210C|nr:PREDICTED: uncharacterized protein LOC109179854 [Ipomoea nil]
MEVYDATQREYLLSNPTLSQNPLPSATRQGAFNGGRQPLRSRRLSSPAFWNSVARNFSGRMVPTRIRSLSFAALCLVLIAIPFLASEALIDGQDVNPPYPKAISVKRCNNVKVQRFRRRNICITLEIGDDILRLYQLIPSHS